MTSGIPEKVVIIPDIHTNFVDAEIVIDNEKPDKTVFLGDYFDSFTETDESTAQTAQWLKDSLKKKDRVHLVGNHDLSYMTSLPHLKSSGFTEYKKYIINMYRIPWEDLKLYCYVHDWLCTHAGVSRQFYEQFSTTNLYDFMLESHEDILKINDAGFYHRFLQCGVSRGGRYKHGGILWCDYDEFVDIPGQKQIFGHTRSHHVRKNDLHICLDTGRRHYAVYENDKMCVKET